MSGFKWTRKRDLVVSALAMGDTVEKAAAAGGVSSRTVYRWLNNPEFAIERDRLTLMLGPSQRAERLRIAYRVIKGRTENSTYPISKADLLDWMKFVQSETDGARIDVAALFEAYALVAGPGQARLPEPARNND